MPEDPDAPDDATANDDGPIITSLRKDRDASQAEALAAKRELALHKAGLGDLSEKQMAALIGAHGDDEWNSDALTATAKEINLAKPAAEPPPTGNDPDEMAAMQRTQAASGGQPQPVLQGDDALKAKLAEAWDSPEAIVAALRNEGRLIE